LTLFASPDTMAAMLSIRLQRVGRKNEPTFRIVLTDSKNGPKSGKSLEVLGSYDSRRGDKADIKVDRVKHWLSHGAQPSGTIHNLLVNKKLIEGKKVNVLPKKRPIKKEGSEAEAKPAAAPVAAAAPAEAPVEAVAAPAETPAN
jgi:small subunit ribosomal protein S16